MVSLQDMYVAEFAKKKGTKNKKRRKDAGSKRSRLVDVGRVTKDARQTWGLGQRSLSTIGHLSREVRGWKKLLG